MASAVNSICDDSSGQMREEEAAESGTAALCWCTGICTGQHKGALVSPGTHTLTHRFSLTIDSAGLIVAIPSLCFSSSWPRASSPLKLPHPLPPYSHLSLLSVAELFIGVCRAKWPVLCWCRRLHFAGILCMLVCLCGQNAVRNSRFSRQFRIRKDNIHLKLS